MAVRSFRIFIENRTHIPSGVPPGQPYQGAMPLTLARVEKCWGEWSEHRSPPHVIPPGDTAEIRAESDGVVAGTAGLFEYHFRPAHTQTPYAAPGNVHTPPVPWPAYRLCVFFDNPYFAGFFGQRTGLAAAMTRVDGIDVNCSRGLTTRQPNVYFSELYNRNNIPWHYRLHRDPDTQDAGQGGNTFTELVFAGLMAGGMPLGNVVHVIGTHRIMSDPVVRLTFAYEHDTAAPEPPEFIPFNPATSSIRPLQGTSTDFWVDRWKAVAQDGRTIRVSVERQSDGLLYASAEDNLLGESFHTEARALSPVIRLADDWSENAWSPVSPFDDQHAIQRPPSPDDQVAINRPAQMNAEDTAMMNRGRRAEIPARQAAERPLVDTLVIDERCYVQSYQLSTGEKRLRYIRYSNQYAPVCDVMLSNRLI